MAAEVGQRFSGWPNSDLSSNDRCTQLDDTVRQMVADHGSVSFGRFAEESLLWEKRSVFAHNRRQEEINKFTMPGLVAQKKAFFEEYYKRKAQKAVDHTETTLEKKSDDITLGNSMLEDKSHAVISEDPVASAPSSSFGPSSTGVSSSDEKQTMQQDPHGLGYLTFNPLFSRITGLQSIQQEEESGTVEKQYAEAELQCTTHTGSKHNGLNHKKLERRVLAPKHVLPTDYGESNIVSSGNVLPASLNFKDLNVHYEKQEPYNCTEVINKSTKGAKDPPSLIHVPRVDLKTISETRKSQDSKDPFHKRVEMKLRALSDRMSADRATASSKFTSYQPSNRSSCQNADRVTTSSRSSFQNNDSAFATSKSATEASHNSFEEVRRAASLPRANVYSKRPRVSHVACSNSSTNKKLAARSSIMPTSFQTTAKPFQTAQVTSKRAGSLTSVINASQNKRKQLSTSAVSDENNQNGGFMRISAPASARSSYDNIRPYKTAKAQNILNGKNMAKTEIVQKSTYGNHPVGGRNVVPNRTLKSKEQSRKVISSRTRSVISSAKNNLTSAVSNKNKPRQERPRWR